MFGWRVDSKKCVLVEPARNVFRYECNLLMVVYAKLHFIAFCTLESSYCVKHKTVLTHSTLIFS